MSKIALLLIGLTLAAPDNLGKRTAPPEKSFAGIGEASADAALEAQIAAAAAFPLGSPENPVRVEGPDGERAYVARLRCGDGKAPAASASRPGGTGGFGTVTDLVALDCGAAGPGRAELRFDLYHEGHVEDRAPAGFTLAPR